jgi:hypothetical protein
VEKFVKTELVISTTPEPLIIRKNFVACELIEED